MKIPMLILTLGAVFAGFVPFGKFVSADGTALHAHEEWTFSIAPVLVAAAGILFAMRMYKTKNDGPDKLAASLSGLYTSASNRFYIDEVYTFVTKKIIFNMIGRPAAWIDKNIVDGSMNGLASLVAWKANFIRVVQSGKVQDYALYFFIGLFGLVALAMYVIN
jgi:NADH-quinone oxidoreductase subunit L